MRYLNFIKEGLSDIVKCKKCFSLRFFNFYECLLDRHMAIAYLPFVISFESCFSTLFNDILISILIGFMSHDILVFNGEELVVLVIIIGVMLSHNTINIRVLKTLFHFFMLFIHREFNWLSYDLLVLWWFGFVTDL